MTPSSPPNLKRPPVKMPLVVPRASMTPLQQLEALRRVQMQAESRVKLGSKLFNAAEAVASQHRVATEQLRKDQDQFHQQIQEEATTRFQSYEEWMQKIDADLSETIIKIQDRIARLEEDWSKTQLRLEAMIGRSDALFMQATDLLNQSSEVLTQALAAAASQDAPAEKKTAAVEDVAETYELQTNDTHDTTATAEDFQTVEQATATPPPPDATPVAMELMHEGSKLLDMSLFDPDQDWTDATLEMPENQAAQEEMEAAESLRLCEEEIAPAPAPGNSSAPASASDLFANSDDDLNHLDADLGRGITFNTTPCDPEPDLAIKLTMDHPMESSDPAVVEEDLHLTLRAEPEPSLIQIQESQAGEIRILPSANHPAIPEYMPEPMTLDQVTQPLQSLEIKHEKTPAESEPELFEAFFLEPAQTIDSIAQAQEEITTAPETPINETAIEAVIDEEEHAEEIPPTAFIDEIADEIADTTPRRTPPKQSPPILKIARDHAEDTSEEVTDEYDDDADKPIPFSQHQNVVTPPSRAPAITEQPQDQTQNEESNAEELPSDFYREMLSRLRKQIKQDRMD